MGGGCFEVDPPRTQRKSERIFDFFVFSILYKNAPNHWMSHEAQLCAVINGMYFHAFNEAPNDNDCGVCVSSVYSLLVFVTLNQTYGNTAQPFRCYSSSLVMRHLRHLMRGWGAQLGQSVFGAQLVLQSILHGWSPKSSQCCRVAEVLNLSKVSSVLNLCCNQYIAKRCVPP